MAKKVSKPSKPPVKPAGKKTKKKAGSSKKSLFRRILRYIGFAIAGFIIVSISGVVIYRFINPPVTLLMVNRTLSNLNKGVTVAKRQWIPFEEIPQGMIDAVVASEDNKFPDHHGFDFGEMKAAFEQNKKGKRLRGGSTITQQTCKNVFLWEGRSYIRKGLEAWFTLWVELIWSKERVMEVYLNVIEMGNGVYGIGAASQVYYHKTATRLSREEAAMIATILPSPRKRNPAKPSAYMYKRQQQILNLMDKIGTVKL